LAYVLTSRANTSSYECWLFAIKLQTHLLPHKRIRIDQGMLF